MAMLLLAFVGMLISCADLPPGPGTEKPDTTSHNFTWQTFTLGDGNSSVLYDVAIINDTLAYAVGEINVQASDGSWKNPPYNLARWDGRTWRLMTVYYIYQEQQFYSPIRAVFAYSANNIWFGIGNMIHWDGQNFNSVQLPPGVWGPYRINKIWGSDNALYIVGDGGSIAQYSNGRWQKLSSGTSLPIQDIWGDVDTRSSRLEIIAVASNKFLNEGKRLLKIEGLTTKMVPDSGLSWSLSGVWFQTNQQYYVVGDGVYPSTSLGTRWSRDEAFPPLYKNAIRGNNRNDVVVVGAFGLVLHYNGSTWKNYTGKELPEISGSYYGVAIKNDVVVCVGQRGDRAIVVIGKRQKGG